MSISLRTCLVAALRVATLVAASAHGSTILYSASRFPDRATLMRLGTATLIGFFLFQKGPS